MAKRLLLTAGLQINATLDFALNTHIKVLAHLGAHF